MNYETEERAQFWANELNKRFGYPPSRAVFLNGIWTVICSWVPKE